MWDAVVAGAGPAGAVAACMLARGGARVLLVDRSAATDKIGETLPGAAVRLLRKLDLPAPAPGGPHRQIAGAFTWWGSDELAANNSIFDPYGPAWRLDRMRFDAALRAAAVQAGAQARAARLEAIARDGICWRIALDDGAVESARFAIDASGRRALLARRLGIKRRREQRLIALYGLGEANGDFALKRTLIEAAPEGWWYAAQLPSGAVLAGLHTEPCAAARLRAKAGEWQRALAGTRYIAPALAAARLTRQLSPLDAGGARLELAGGDGWVACGDAAMSFDPLSGQGIFNALHGGMAAGQAVAAALQGNASGLAAYAARLEQVWAIYWARSRAIYASERRWPDQPFWSRMRPAIAA